MARFAGRFPIRAGEEEPLVAPMGDAVMHDGGRRHAPVLPAALAERMRRQVFEPAGQPAPVLVERPPGLLAAALAVMDPSLRAAEIEHV